MNEVLNTLGMFYSWEEIMERYNEIQRQAFAAIEQMDLDAIHRFNQLYKFRGDIMEECKTELAHYLQKYPQFHAITLEGIFEKMRRTLIKYNNETGTDLLYINAIPQFTSAVASITASRCKLPLWIIAKGTTERCHAQVGDPQGHLVTHSGNGWTTVETFGEYLMSLRERYPDGDPVYLVLDCYSVHRTDEIRQWQQRSE